MTSPKRALGASGIQVSAIGLGGMPMSIAGRPSEGDAIRVCHAAFAAGIDFVDTADVYCLNDDDIGHNERLIQKAIETWTETKITVATKGGLERPGGAWVTNGRPEHLALACDKSLAALGVETIDLYQLHAPDDDVPFVDSVEALARLKEAGKIRNVGLSNVSVAQIEEARSIVPIVSVQNRLHPLAARPLKDGTVEYCAKNGIAFLPYSPVGGGRDRKSVRKNRALVTAGEQLGHTPQEIALAWLLKKSPCMIPIPGASKVESIQSSARAMAIELPSEVESQLDQAFL